MNKRKLLRFGGAGALTLAAGLALTGSAFASSKPQLVKVRDDCDPASFNAAVGPGTCIGNGKTVFSDFIDQLVDHGFAGAWRFSPSTFHVDAGRDLLIRNDGGEFHTFSQVVQFGGGCVPQINGVLGLAPSPLCQPEVAPGVPLAFVTTGVPPGQTLTITGLSPGVHTFQCLIHPWMHVTVDVRSD